MEQSRPSICTGTGISNTAEPEKHSRDTTKIEKGRKTHRPGIPELAWSRGQSRPGIPALLGESATERHRGLPPRPERAASTSSRVQGQGFVRGRGEELFVGRVRLFVRGRTLAGVRPPPQREALGVEGAVGCSCTDRSGLSEFRPVMPFPKTRARKRPRSNEGVSRVMPEKFSDILNRQPMLDYAKRRSLSGQREFMQSRKHRPDPTPDITADKTAGRE